MTTHEHTSRLHAHDAHGDGDHESIHDHSGGHDEQRHHGSHHRGHDGGHGHEDMLEVEQAFERIMSHFEPLGAVELPALETLGMTLAEDITSPLDLPPLANSAMDGYAVLHADIAGSGETPPTLSVISAVAAGQVSADTVSRGKAIRIMTGAPVPDGADTVVPFEETDEIDRRRAGKSLDEIVIRKALPLGSNVRPAGEDVSAGELVLSAGTVVRPAEAGVMASLGLATARVIRRPVVAVLSTGDELTRTGESLTPGHIYDSNSSSLAAAVIAAGGTPRMMGIARDNLDDLHRCIDEASDADMLVTSAGVSKGDYDMVKDVLEQRGDMNFWSVRMRPGQAPGLRFDTHSAGSAVAVAGPARKPGKRVAGLRDVRPAGDPADAGTRPAGSPGCGRRADRPDIQQRWPASVRPGGGRAEERRLVRHAHRPPGFQYPHLAIPGERPGHLPCRPAPQECRAGCKNNHAGLERRG